MRLAVVTNLVKLAYAAFDSLLYVSVSINQCHSNLLWPAPVTPLAREGLPFTLILPAVKKIVLCENRLPTLLATSAAGLLQADAHISLVDKLQCQELGLMRLTVQLQESLYETSSPSSRSMFTPKTLWTAFIKLTNLAIRLTPPESQYCFCKLFSTPWRTTVADSVAASCSMPSWIYCAAS